MAENNSSAPLKTAEGSYPALPAPDTHCHDEDTGRDVWSYSAEQMRAYAAQAVAAQAAPAAVAVTDAQIDAILDEPGGMIFYVSDQRQKQHLFARRVLALATPALPVTEDSSAGDLAEEKIADEMSREERMIVLQRDSDGTPTVWCDPEIADIVCALNSGGVKTVASCSGHGVKPGGVALADGRQLLLLESLEAFNSAMSAITQAVVQAEPVAKLSVHMSEFDAGEIRKAASISMIWKSVNELPLGDYQLYTAPQAQPADALDAEIAKLKKTYQELGNMFHDQIVTQQAAWIEWQHGAGAEAGMQWIENGLCGPGHIPDEDEPYGTEAQAYFDANKSDPFPACYCGRPSNILWMGKGFCSDAHHDEHRAAMAAAQEGGNAAKEA